MELDTFVVREETVLVDPLSLKRYQLDDQELSSLKKSNPKVVEFYKRQNELIETLIAPPGQIPHGEEERLVKLKIAVYGSFAANVVLFALQLTAAILSSSLALFATTADAFMDLASATVLVYTNRLASQDEYLVYPTGKSRFETAGIIVFATLMATLSIQIVVTSCERFAAGQSDIDFGPISISLVGVALLTKIMLYFYCKALSHYPSAKILAQDHRNDIIFNSTGIVFGLLAKYFAWWIDPTAALLIAALIFRSWASTGKEHIQQLVGKSADSEFLTHLTYIAMTHDERIQCVDTCRAYHAGTNFYVEVDIVLPPDMPLIEAHDIGESLQIKFESLPNVERAFVHLDYETDHKPEHKKQK